MEEFWTGVITDPSKLVLTRDELTSILLFLLCKAEVPDLYTQMRLTNEFTSPDIQEANRAYPISELYMLLYTTVHWISSLDPQKISEDKTYLLRAQVEMREEDFTRYDRIRFSEVGGDRFDPFSVDRGNNVKNSYIVGDRDIFLNHSFNSEQSRALLAKKSMIGSAQRF